MKLKKSLAICDNQPMIVVSDELSGVVSDVTSGISTMHTSSTVEHVYWLSVDGFMFSFSGSFIKGFTLALYTREPSHGSGSGYSGVGAFLSPKC